MFIKKESGAFDEEIPKAKYLFDLEKGRPILRHSFGSLTEFELQRRGRPHSVDSYHRGSKFHS